VVSDLKTINEQFEQFLNKLAKAEEDLKNLVARAEEDAGRLVAEAAHRTTAMEEAYKKKLDELREILMKQIEEIIAGLRESTELELEAEKRRLVEAFENNKEKAVKVVLESLFG